MLYNSFIYSKKFSKIELEKNIISIDPHLLHGTCSFAVVTSFCLLLVWLSSTFLPRTQCGMHIFNKDFQKEK